MARVRFELPSLLVEFADGASAVEVDADTVAGALAALARERPALARQLVDDAGRVRQHVLLFHREVNTRWTDGVEARLEDGDVIRVMQAVSGG